MSEIFGPVKLIIGRTKKNINFEQSFVNLRGIMYKTIILLYELMFNTIRMSSLNIKNLKMGYLVRFLFCYFCCKILAFQWLK